LKPFQLVFRFARRYKLALALTITSMLLLVGAQLVIPWVIKVLISTVTDVATTGGSAQNIILQLTLAVLAIYILRGGLQFLRSYMAHVAGWGVVADMRKYLYNHLQRLSLRFYEDKQTGQLMSRVINDTDLFEQMIAHAVPDVFVNVITLIGVSVVLFGLNWRLTLLSMIPIPLVILTLQIFTRYVRPAFRARQKELGELNAMLNDNLHGIREIKAFNQEEDQFQRIGSGVDRYLQVNLRALRLMATVQPFIDFSSSLGTLIVIYFGGQLAFQQVLPVSDLVAFFLYLEMFYQPVRNLSNAWEAIQNASAGADRVADLLAEQQEPLERKGAIELQQRAAGALKFEHVSFRYKQGDSVLEDISLDIPARHVVALVGPTGVGKTTLASLIPRFHDVIDGAISMDGTDIRDLTLESLRSQISMVLQDVFLFHGTVRENILFGRPTASDDDMLAAAKVANAHDFIMLLPDGYDTLIGERGIKLSGGQKQRLSIARAVLKDAPILILDEATSSVDTETELLIQQALERLMVGKTTIIIAHRLSTVRNADLIVVLEGKQIKESGTHAELISSQGLYQRLYTVQQRMDAQAELN
jgi:ATP-binding cassette subfamily B protein/subfamily B ATP-binding cassette protein MsbA